MVWILEAGGVAGVSSNGLLHPLLHPERMDRLLNTTGLAI